MNEFTTFPTSIDTFPTLSNYATGVPKDLYTFRVEYYNKIANCINTLETLMRTTLTGTGDGSIKGLSYAVGFTLPMAALLQNAAPAAFSSPTIQQPGNVLPFEVLFTCSNANYGDWLFKEGTSRMLYQGSLATITALFGGVSPFNTAKPMVTCAIRRASGLKVDSGVSTIHSRFLANTTCIADAENLIIRGCVIDFGMTDELTNADDWIVKNMVLEISVCAVAT